MIDIHSHILPDWDDGPRTLEESLRMLTIAAGSGTTGIVATPHANSQYRFDAGVIQQRFHELTAAAGSLIQLHLGCDFHLSYENVQDALQNPSKYTINNKTYLMVELPDLVIAESARSILSRLRSAGIIPVITHPERNTQIQGRLDILNQWVRDGCLLQITAQSLLGRFGLEAERCCHSLLSAKMVHFVASDAHDCEDRPPRLDLAYRHVAQHYGASLAERLFRINPAAVLAGDPLEESRPMTDQPWYRFWK